MAYFARTYDRAWAGPFGLFTVLYLGVGLIVAGVYDYFDRVNTFEQGLEAALAVVLWPLVLLGVEMRFD